MGTESTTIAVQEPALSFVFDATQSLYEQLTKSLQQTAASEVGASLAAQQAHHNLMAQYQGAAGGMQYHAGVQGSQSGPSYRGRSQSIQSAVPIDYREHSSDSQKIQAQPVAHGMHSVQLARQARASQAQLQQDSYMDGVPGFSGYGYAADAEFPLDHSQQRLTSYGGADINRAGSMGDFDLGQAGMSYDMLQPLPREVPLYAPLDSIGSESDFRATVPMYRQALDDDGFAVPYDVSSSLSSCPPEPFGYNQLCDPAMGFGMPRNFSVSQGTPSYKQRRRRQSIPSSLILAEHAQIARDRYEQRAGTEPQVSDRPTSKHLTNVSRGRSMTNTPQDQSQDHLLQQMIHSSNIYDEPLSYKQDCEIADLERCGSRGTSTFSHGSPYSTTSYGCPVTGCNRLFKRLEHMKRHVRTHTHDRPHVCDPCGKSFARADNLAQHMQMHERGSSSSSDFPPEFDNLQYYGQASHEYNMPQMNYDDLSNYSDVEGSEASYVLPYEDRAFSTSRSIDERSLSFHNGADFVLSQVNAEQNTDNDYSDLQIDPISFRDSLNPPSPRTLPVNDQGAGTQEGEVTPREPTSRVGSTSETGSCDYVPGPGDHGMMGQSAPRSFGEERWMDTDMTPRQEQFKVPEQGSKQEEMKEGVSAEQMWS